LVKKVELFLSIDYDFLAGAALEIMHADAGSRNSAVIMASATHAGMPIGPQLSDANP